MSTKVLTCVVSVVFTLSGLVRGDWSSQCPSGCECKWVSGKKSALCSKAGFTEIPPQLSPDIHLLDLSKNQLNALGRMEFQKKGLVNLHRLYLHGCGIVELHRDAFMDLTIMVELDLSDNNIETLHPDTFRGNNRLKFLSLNGNPLKKLGAQAFTYLPHLRTLHMSRCKLEVIHEQAFINIKSLESIVLSYNYFEKLTEIPFVHLSNLKTLSLQNNPWKCDCHLKRFRDWLFDNSLYVHPTACAEPPRLIARTWDEVTPVDFACPPEIYIPEPHVYSYEGQNVTLSCRVIANPPAETHWVLGGRILVHLSQIPFSEQMYLVQVNGDLLKWNNLTITHVNEQDTGAYTCVGRNPGGAVETNVTLQLVTPSNPGPLIPESFKLPVVIGVSVACAVLLLVLLLCCCSCCCRRRRKKPVAQPAKSSGIMIKHELDSFSTASSPSKMGSYKQIPQTDLELVEKIPPSYENFDEINYGSSLSSRDDLKVKESLEKAPQPLEETFLNETLSGGKEDPSQPGYYPDLLDIPHRHRPNSSIGSVSGSTTHSGHFDPKMSFLNDSTRSGSPLLNSSKANVPLRPAYVTLPRRPRTPSWGGSSTTPSSKSFVRLEPIYDNLGPRTTADGSSRMALNRLDSTSPLVSPISPVTPGMSFYFEPQKGDLNRGPNHFSTLPRSVGSIPDSLKRLSIPHSRNLSLIDNQPARGKLKKVKPPVPSKPNRVHSPPLDTSTPNGSVLQEVLAASNLPHHSAIDNIGDISDNVISKPSGNRRAQEDDNNNANLRAVTNKRVPPKVPPKPKKSVNSFSLGQGFQDESEEGTEI